MLERMKALAKVFLIEIKVVQETYFFFLPVPHGSLC